jgi:hypothetical protein
MQKFATFGCALKFSAPSTYVIAADTVAPKLPELRAMIKR